MRFALILLIAWFAYAAFALNQAERRLDRCQSSPADHHQELFK